MAKITSKALLNVGTELTIDETARTFTLNVAGNLIAKEEGFDALGVIRSHRRLKGGL